MAEEEPTAQTRGADKASETNDKLQSLELPPEERLNDLIAQATALYAVKDYSPAAELYSQATELQAELNGEMNPENADLLYSYGKCLYFVAVRNSEVLGASSAGGKLSAKNDQSKSKPAKKRKFKGDDAEQTETSSTVNGQERETGASISEPAQGSAIPQLEQVLKKENAGPSSSDKPLFNITGDENWDDSDEDVEEDENDANGDPDAEDGEDEDDQDDFSLAYEILDIARVLLLRKLDTLSDSLAQRDQPKPTSQSEPTNFIPSISQAPEIRTIKDRLSDVYDLQAEISLEGERYTAAVTDFRASLALKEELHPTSSSLIAEGHYKLSLALEFGSKTQQRDADGNPTGPPEIDQAMRAESIQEMERAIDSCTRRIAKEQLEVDHLPADSPRREKAIKDIDDVREMVEEMRQRLDDLRAEPVLDAVSEAQRQQVPELDGGLLKEILAKSGGSREGARRLLEEAAGGARDLSGLVKRKGKSAAGSGVGTPEPTAAAAGENGSAVLGKRKTVAFADEVDQEGGSTAQKAEQRQQQQQSKRAKVEDAEDSGL